MKVTLNNTQPSITYPVMAQGRKTGAIVVFTSQYNGVCLSQGNSDLKPFNKYSSLLPINHPDWRILDSTETLTLSN